MIKYLARWKWREAAIIAVKVEYETPKTWQGQVDREIIGTLCYLPRRPNKDEYPLFPTVREALEYIYGLAVAEAEATERAAVEARASAEAVKRLIEERKETP